VFIYLVKDNVTDNVSREKRSQVMASVKQKNTSPEITVRKYLHRQGLRFKLHDKALPGKPDMVFPKYKIVVFIHGCFWHGHKKCKLARMPKSNVDFWKNKIDGNKTRDSKHIKKLKRIGWCPIIFWECELSNPKNLINLSNKIKSSTA